MSEPEKKEDELGGEAGGTRIAEGTGETSEEILQKITGLDEELKKTPEPGTKPEGKDGKDNGDGKDNNLVRKLRRELEDRDKELKELRAKSSAPPEKKDTPPPERKETPPTRQPTPQERQTDNEKAFVILDRATRALAGEVIQGLDSPDKAKEIKNLAVEVIRSMTPEELLAVKQKAEAGGFGHASDTIAELATKEMTTVLGQSHVQSEQAKVEGERAAQFHRDIDSAMVGVHQKYPALKPTADGKETEELKFAKGWFEENVGTNENPGMFFHVIAKDPAKHIPKMFDRMMGDFKASKLDAVSAERDQLRRKMEHFSNPEGGTRPASGGESVKESDQILGQLRERGVETG